MVERYIRLAFQIDITVQKCLFKENTVNYHGGATSMIQATRSFVNCILERNSVKSRPQKGGLGGAIFALYNSYLTMHQCIFKENKATYSGGAIYIQRTRGSFVNCTFERNSVKSRLQKIGVGGAICALDNSHLTMHQCIFKENTATNVCGATHMENSQSLFESSIFERIKVNSLNQDTRGGAISALDADTNITIKQCLFIENTASQNGGATYIQKSQSLFESCIFLRNKVNSLQQKTRGGAISALDADTNVTITQCLIFKENTAT